MSIIMMKATLLASAFSISQTLALGLISSKPVAYLSKKPLKVIKIAETKEPEFKLVREQILNKNRGSELVKKFKKLSLSPAKAKAESISKTDSLNLLRDNIHFYEFNKKSTLPGKMHDDLPNFEDVLKLDGIKTASNEKTWVMKIGATGTGKSMIDSAYKEMMNFNSSTNSDDDHFEASQDDLVEKFDFYKVGVLGMMLTKENVTEEDLVNQGWCKRQVTTDSEKLYLNTEKLELNKREKIMTTTLKNYLKNLEFYQDYMKTKFRGNDIQFESEVVKYLKDFNDLDDTESDIACEVIANYVNDDSNYFGNLSNKTLKHVAAWTRFKYWEEVVKQNVETILQGSKYMSILSKSALSNKFINDSLIGKINDNWNHIFFHAAKPLAASDVIIDALKSDINRNQAKLLAQRMQNFYFDCRNLFGLSTVFDWVVVPHSLSKKLAVQEAVGDRMYNRDPKSSIPHVLQWTVTDKNIPEAVRDYTTSQWTNEYDKRDLVLVLANATDTIIPRNLTRAQKAINHFNETIKSNGNTFTAASTNTTTEGPLNLGFVTNHTIGAPRIPSKIISNPYPKNKSDMPDKSDDSIFNHSAPFISMFYQIRKSLGQIITGCDPNSESIDAQCVPGGFDRIFIVRNENGDDKMKLLSMIDLNGKFNSSSKSSTGPQPVVDTSITIKTEKQMNTYLDNLFQNTTGLDFNWNSDLVPNSDVVKRYFGN